MFSTVNLVPMALCALISYLLGSLNFAIIVGHIYAKEDIRNYGSGNAGMTNILRTYGKKPAFFTGAGDLLKGILALAISRIIFQMSGVVFMDSGYFSGLFVLLGHLYPLYFRFKGGKGVMTSLGIMLLVNPLVFLIVVVIFVPIVFITRIVSLASILGAIGFPIITFVVQTALGRPALYETLCALVFGIILLAKHHENIGRLLKGTENRFGKPGKK
ncbi:glycerol-3-phosphate 1-O-acyltransferase PlsY [Oscillospiraceae bacterium MB08-C2-2]|nr:glycerol-3-phosphate 1-O-acyltransferase PlsY [Oscillospiraceae bacterium MB08-C2-2]